MRRLLLVFVTGAALVVPSWLPGAAQARTPSVTRLVQAAGPLHPAKVTLRGRDLGRVTGVRFGAARATQLRHHGAKSITVRTPRRRSPGRVPVSILTAGHWQRVGRYQFAARPVVTKLSATGGEVVGGGTLTLRGRALSPNAAVLFGHEHATILRATRHRLTVHVPPSAPGRTKVRVRTAGGTSRAHAYTYRIPQARETSSYTTGADVFTAAATDVQWVTGGPDAGNHATAGRDWVVSLDQGATVPQVDQGFYLAPGGDAFPSGLTGVVASLASQIDGSTRITVTPTAISSNFSNVSVAFTGADSTSGSRTPARSAAPSDTSIGVDQDFADETTYSNVKGNAFDCENKLGQPSSFTGGLSLTFTRFVPDVYFTTTPAPRFDAWVAGTVVVSGKITAHRDVTCKLDPLWVDAHRRVIPLGTTGATLSVGPAAELTLSAGGTVEVSQTTRFMYGVSKLNDGPVEWYHVAAGSADASLNAEVSLTASVGLSVQVGILDRVGAQLKGEIYGEGSLTAPLASTQPKACVKFDAGFKIGVNAFLDLFVARWESPSRTYKIEVELFKKCVSPPSDVPASGAPVIATTVLPDATLGEPYDEQLDTADDRSGSWQVVAGALPPGLALTSDGEVQGTPTGGVGTSRPTVKFTDDSQQSTRSAVALTVVPDQGLGGGDMQATLTWDGAADLDLHASEPDGNEIYYNNPGPSAEGGELDHDSNAACAFVDPSPTENIHWPEDQAEAGAYFVWVQTYNTCDSADLSWHLTVRIRGEVVLDTTGSDTSDAYEIDYGGSQDHTPQVRRVSLARLGIVGDNPPKT